MNRSTIQVRVSRKETVATDICAFELVSADGAPLPAFSAGSHVDVHLPSGMTRQYSLCNDSGEHHRYVLGVLRDSSGRGGSKTMHDLVKEGDFLEISAPKNHFPLASGAKRSLLLAGGIGITPILCMAERLANVGDAFEMHYCTRSQERTAFYDRIQQAAYAASVAFHFDDGGAEQRLDLPALLASPEPGRHLYVCGPKGFMDAVLNTARAAGWTADHLHYEFFSAEVEKRADDGSFEVKLASSGKTIAVAKDCTVVQALADIGIEVQTSCEMGVCGTCITRVLEGEPDHRDMYLTPEEQAKNDQFLPCCSRSKSPMLVLDL